MSAVVEARTRKIVAWRDGIPLRYEYTAGVAGEAFLRGLIGGKIVASKCSRCGEVRLPPRTYCLQCYSRTTVQVELLHSGRIAAYSEARLGAGGAKRRLHAGTTFGFVTFEGVEGGLIHRVLHEGRTKPKVGEPVRPLFAPPERRVGSILDLEGFRTAPSRRGGNR